MKEKNKSSKNSSYVYTLFMILFPLKLTKTQLQWAVTRDSNRLSKHFISQKWFFNLVLLYFVIKLNWKKL